MKSAGHPFFMCSGIDSSMNCMFSRTSASNFGGSQARIGSEESSTASQMWRGSLYPFDPGLCFFIIKKIEAPSSSLSCDPLEAGGSQSPERTDSELSVRD